MLKKLSIALCISSLFGAGVAMADAGEASGVINFRGSVTHESPIVVVKQGTSEAGDPLTSSPNVELGVIPASELDKVTTFNAEKSRKFRIVIQRPTGTQYNHVQTVALTLTADVKNGILLNSSEQQQVTGSADNVGVALQYYGTSGYAGNASAVFGNQTGVQKSVVLNGPEGGFAYEEMDPTFYFAAALQQIDINENIGGGEVRSSVTVNLTYE